MSNYYTPSKGIVNRYWKRPKPRVYECNIRDAERFYQQSYKDYIEAKEWAAKRESEDRSRIGDSSTSAWSVRRANLVTDSLSRDIPDHDSTSRSSYLNANSSRHYGDDTHSSSFRSSSISGSRNRSPDSDMGSMEERLQRLQKLRSELGLPSSEVATGASKVTFSLPSSTDSTSNLSKRRIISSPDPRDRRGKTVDVSNASSYSSARGGSRTRATDYASDSYGDKLSSGTERSSRFVSKYSSEDSYDLKPKQNGIGPSYSKDEGDKYSYKSSYKNNKRYDDDDSSYSYKPLKSRDTGESESYKSSRRPPPLEDNDLEDYDADAYLSNIKKKFPTSEEILERIKKMDSDM